MPLPPTPYYLSHLKTIHERVLVEPMVQQHFTGTAIRVDGEDLGVDWTFALPNGAVLSSMEGVYLFSIFDGSRVHFEVEDEHPLDDAPPGLYATIINGAVIQPPRKNKIGLFAGTNGDGLFIDGLHIDKFFLQGGVVRKGLGSAAFTLCAITAHLAELDEISLVAAGGKGSQTKHVGYKVWPKLGFDAPLEPGEVDDHDELADCKTVLDVLAINPQWWEKNGSQRGMTFDLHANSRSWVKLLAYLR